ncbi:MAG: HTTM domain-containing protein, partial [Siphonobacter sp.]
FVTHPRTGEVEKVKLRKYLLPSQIEKFAASPDMIWEFAQYLKKDYQRQGETVEIHVKAFKSVNKSKPYPFIDEHTDLAKVTWNYFGHQAWILPKPDDLKLSYY